MTDPNYEPKLSDLMPPSSPPAARDDDKYRREIIRQGKIAVLVVVITMAAGTVWIVLQARGIL